MQHSVLLPRALPSHRMCDVPRLGVVFRGVHLPQCLVLYTLVARVRHQRGMSSTIVRDVCTVFVCAGLRVVFIVSLSSWNSE